MKIAGKTICTVLVIAAIMLILSGCSKEQVMDGWDIIRNIGILATGEDPGEETVRNDNPLEGTDDTGVKTDSTDAETAQEDDFDREAFVRPTPTLVIEVNGKILYADLEDNSAVQAFVEKLSPQQIEVDMHDYGDFEKVGDLPWDLPQDDRQITAEPGDIILYDGDQITIYYDQNTWELTKLAEIGNTTREDLLEVLGDGDVTVSMWLEWSE